jgi:hypothetical protein
MCVDAMLMRSVSIWEVFSMNKKIKQSMFYCRVHCFFLETQELTIILTVLSIVPDVYAIIFTFIINVDKQLKRPSSK